MNIKNLVAGKFLPATIDADGVVKVHATKDAALKQAGAAFFWFRLNQTMINDALTPRLSVKSVKVLAERVAALPAVEGDETASAAVNRALDGAPEDLVAAAAAVTRPAWAAVGLTTADLLARQLADLARDVES